jgi:hypothetical protein
VKKYVIASAILGLMAGPVTAQTPPNPASPPGDSAPVSPAPVPAKPATPTATPESASAPAAGGSFIAEQDRMQWLASEMIGASVIGPNNENIGSINDVVVGENGAVQAAVIGVGGFLGIGKKNVAVPFTALQVTKAQSGSVGNIKLAMTKAELASAPSFKSLAAQNSERPSMTTGAAPRATDEAPTGSTKPVK